ncbi:MAG: BACON domain-containing protein [Bacteroidales bacterium]|jgi:hypothetical protein|nr:BACON domain-containing protein [Bacteroidales bacterium]
MRKVLYILLLALPVLAGCKKDPLDVTTPVQKMKILKGELTFDPLGGEDEFTYSAESTVTLEQDSPWCHASLSGKGSIKVTVDKHERLESRYAFIRVHCEDETALLTVHQFGVTVSLDNEDVQFDNKKSSFEREFSVNYPISFESEADWIHPTVSENKISVEVDENESKDFRKGYIVYTCGDYKDSLAVIQFDPVDAGMTGDYTWNCIRIANNRALQLNASLSKNADTGAFTLTITQSTAMTLTIDVSLKGFVMEIPLGKQVGTYVARGTTYYVFPIIAYTQILAYENATTSGTYPFVFEKNDAGKWVATADHSKYEGDQFMFAMWPTTAHTGNSEANSLNLKDITLTHK